MANVRSEKESEQIRRKILGSAAKLFLQKGYSNTSVREISALSGISTNTIFYEMKNKEEILCNLVQYVLGSQFRTTEELLENIPHDKMMFYAAETTLQLHMAESSENIRDIYSAAYSMPRSSEIIQHTITGKLEEIFKEHLPDLETKDFYKLEIATGGIMRGFMTIPCNMWFTMDQKVESFLECTFKLYDVPKEKIRETIDFVSRFDFVKIAQDTIDSTLSYLENKT